MDYALDLMKNNAFLHFFPQARTVDDHEEPKRIKIPSDEGDHELKKRLKDVTLRDKDFEKGYELKWGLARLLLETLGEESSRRRVLLLPFYHLGMNHALPNERYYIPRVFKTIYVYIRDAGPIQFDHEYLKNVCFNGDTNIPIHLKRSLIMKRVEEELKLIKLKAIQFKQTFE